MFTVLRDFTSFQSYGKNSGPLTTTNIFQALNKDIYFNNRLFLNQKSKPLFSSFLGVFSINAL